MIWCTPNIYCMLYCCMLYWANLVNKFKNISLNCNMNLSHIPNSMLLFTFFFFDREYLFWAKIESVSLG